MLYSINNQYPTELPFRIRLSNGLTRTSPATFTEEDIADAGYVPIAVPDYDSASQYLVWDGVSFTVAALPPPSSSPNWDAFNAYMLTDATFKSYRDAVRPIDGDLNSYLSDAYELIETNGVGAFSLVWGKWVAVSQITTEDRETIATVAESFNLPADFVCIIRGNCDEIN